MVPRRCSPSVMPRARWSSASSTTAAPFACFRRHGRAPSRRCPRLVARGPAHRRSTLRVTVCRDACRRRVSATITNLGYSIESARLAERFQLARVELANDFYALSLYAARIAAQLEAQVWSQGWSATDRARAGPARGHPVRSTSWRSRCTRRTLAAGRRHRHGAGVGAASVAKRCRQRPR